MSVCPKSLRINGFDWEIVEDGRYLEGSGKWGQTSHEKLNILLDPTSLPQVQRETFLHELIHASVDTLLTKDWILTEEVCYIVARALYGALADNPDAVAFIFPGDPGHG